MYTPDAGQGLDLVCACMSLGLAEQIAQPCYTGKWPISGPGLVVFLRGPCLMSAHGVPGPMLDAEVASEMPRMRSAQCPAHK